MQERYNYGEPNKAPYWPDKITEYKSLIVHGVTLVPLAICFLCCLGPYLIAFKRNLAAHGLSPLLPLVSHSFRTIKFNYPGFLILVALCGLYKLAKGNGALAAAEFARNISLVLGLSLSIYVGMYQFAISFVSIHRFFNNRHLPEFRRNLTRRNVLILMVGAFLVMIVTNIGFVFASSAALHFGTMEQIDKLSFYYESLYIMHQIFLFIAMGLQFSMRFVPPTSHSENVIAIHTKAIGAIKLGLGIVACISYFTDSFSFATSYLFFSIDWFLVPVVIELTEIRANPSVVQSDDKKDDFIKF
ncbi:unnamed protein product [Caenorhabditis brenneri]